LDRATIVRGVEGAVDWLELGQQMDEIIPRDDPNRRMAMENVALRQTESENPSAVAALDMVSEAAAAIRQLEEQASEAVARARSIADAVVEKLEVANARADRAERAQRRAEAEAVELNSTLNATREELEALRIHLAAKDSELADTLQRAEQAEWRADDAQRRAQEANAGIDRIVQAIRTQLPLKLEPIANE
jgi:hypothetical protein